MTATTYQALARRVSLKAALVLALLAGSLMPLSLAPLNFWPLAFIAVIALPLLLSGKTSRNTVAIAFSFGLGLYGVGASWVFVSIYEFGGTDLWLAVLMTALFVTFLALIFALPLCLLNLRSFNASQNLWLYLLSFTALWVLGEWVRSWLLTGFPWLFIGYSQLPTALAGWASSFGVFGVSFTVVLCGGAISVMLTARNWAQRSLAIALFSSLWVGGWSLGQANWTQPQQQQNVSLIQANIPQALKWHPDFLNTTLARYQSLSAPAWQHSDWIIWPEAAIPLLYQDANPLLNNMAQQALNTDTALITGILYDKPKDGKIYNSAIALGNGEGAYFKTRLVPFGEYVPLEDQLRGIINFFNMPTSYISSGQPNQRGLFANGNAIAAAICYEIVYPDLVAELAVNRGAIITISNDAWFGHSWGPLQHLQMAQMRARETQRYVLRATNNGVSAIISPQGNIEKRSQQFVQQVITANIYTVSGNTPFMNWGSTPIIGLCLVLLGLCSYLRQKRD